MILFKSREKKITNTKTKNDNEAIVNMEFSWETKQFVNPVATS